MILERGFRAKLDDYFNINIPLQIKVITVGNDEYDSCCFGVDINEKLSDDRYMVFYNQPASPKNEIEYSAQGDTASYIVNLNKLPETIKKLVFTVSIDGNGTMGKIRSHAIQIYQNNQLVMDFSLTGNDFQNEKAIIGLEIYHKSVWRISAVGRGFNGGIGELLKSFGGEIAEEQNVQKPMPDIKNVSENEEEKLANKLMSRINLSKDKVKLEKHVVNLSKCVVDLSKRSGVDLGNTRAKVVVALDYSGSMTSLYRKGVVQSTINRLIPLGLTFDDNGSIDLFLFQNDFRKMYDLDLSNYEDYVENIISRSGYRMGGTNYAPVLRAIIDGYNVSNGIFSRSTFVPPIVDNGDPTFILFITDGENADRRSTDDIILECSSKNVFIQFIGIGNESFRYLEKLDDMQGRARDNTGFSKMSDLSSVNDSELYENVLGQFSNWLKGLQ